MEDKWEWELKAADEEILTLSASELNRLIQSGEISLNSIVRPKGIPFHWATISSARNRILTQSYIEQHREKFRESRARLEQMPKAPSEFDRLGWDAKLFSYSCGLLFLVWILTPVVLVILALCFII